jgi:hypothetical protein
MQPSGQCRDQISLGVTTACGAALVPTARKQQECSNTTLPIGWVA